MARAKRKTQLDELREALPRGYSISTWSPGDGVTRYRFFDDGTRSYFGGNGIYTALGFKQAAIFALGLGNR
jgi:hypothetical protein